MLLVPKLKIQDWVNAIDNTNRWIHCALKGNFLF